MEIIRAADRTAAPGPADWFTGEVRHEKLIEAADPSRVTASLVTFRPGARTAWHTHPVGQTLVVTEGAGWVCRDGGPRADIGPGDVIWFAPGERHWHGATATTALTHLAIQERHDGRAVDWAEPVSDADYNG